MRLDKLIFETLLVVSFVQVAAACEGCGPEVFRNGKSAEFETFWEPDPKFGYDRIPVRYVRSEAECEDIWEVKAPKTSGSWHVLPEKTVDILEANDESVRFKLSHAITQPTHIAVLKGNRRMGYLFFDPPGYLPVPEDAINVTDLGIQPNTDELLSSSINQELVKLSAAGGGTLYFPSGVYTISTIKMQNNTSLYLEEGAVLQATFDADAYPLDAPGLENKDLPRTLRPGHRRRLILFDHVENATVLGKGVIDAQGSEWRRRTMLGQRAYLNHIRMVGCRNIQLEGIILRDSEFWSTHILLSQDVRINGIKVVNEIPPPRWDRFVRPKSGSMWNNADGINPDSSQDVSVTHTFLHTGDDCLPIKNTSSYMGKLQDVRDITVRSCMMITPVTAMKLGTETLGGRMENILFEDIEVVYASRIISTDLTDGITASGITYRDLRVFACNRPFDFWIHNRRDEPDQKLFSNLRNVVLDTVNIRDFDVEEGDGEISHIQGYDSQHTVEDIVFRNFTLQGSPVNEIDDMPIQTNEFISNIRFE